MTALATGVAYTLDNAHRRAGERLGRLEAAYDPGTVRLLAALGVGPGWRCLEAGAGAGSIAAWLGDRVGPTGHVLATDLDPRLVEPLAAGRPNLEIWRHDIAAEPLPAAAFGLVHARMVLEHVPGREQALASMVAAVAPGGWLVVEAVDFISEAVDPATNPAAAARFARWHAARTRLLADRGFDHAFARGAAGRLRRLGLTDVATEGRAATWHGGSTGAQVWRLSLAQLGDPLVAAGYLAAAEIPPLEQLFADPAFAATSPLVIAAWGRRPA